MNDWTVRVERDNGTNVAVRLDDEDIVLVMARLFILLAHWAGNGRTKVGVVSVLNVLRPPKPTNEVTTLW